MRGLLAALLCGLLAACQGVPVHEVRSAFSHIRISDYGAQRMMLFVDADGDTTVETVMHRDQPHRLQHPYSHTLMAGLLYLPDPPNPSASLLVGLGGGAVVRFLNHEFPGMQLDVVEIDPVVVQMAREFFGTVPGSRTRLLVEDAFEYLRRTDERYDIIFMDAHLRPREETDASGQPLRLKTAAFLRSLHERLNPGGVVVFNLMEGSHTGADIATLRAAFAQAVVFRSAWRGNLIVVALQAGGRVDDEELGRRARELDRRSGRGMRGFSFEGLLEERGG